MCKIAGVLHELWIFKVRVVQSVVSMGKFLEFLKAQHTINSRYSCACVNGLQIFFWGGGGGNKV